MVLFEGFMLSPSVMFNSLQPHGLMSWLKENSLGVGLDLHLSALASPPCTDRGGIRVEFLPAMDQLQSSIFCGF